MSSFRHCCTAILTLELDLKKSDFVEVEDEHVNRERLIHEIEDEHALLFPFYELCVTDSSSFGLLTKLPSS